MRDCWSIIVLTTLFIAGISPANSQEAFPEQMPAIAITPLERAVPKSLDLEGAVAKSPEVALPVLSTTESADLFTDYAPLPGGSKVKIGVDRDVNAEGPSTAKSALGTTTHLKDGTVLWTLRILSKGAKGIRLHLLGCDLGDAAELVVYNAESPAEAVGPITGLGPNGNGEFYTPTVFAEEVVLEYSAPGLPDTVPFQIVGINHLATDGEVNKEDKELSCHNDITCYSGYAYRSAIGRLYFVEGSAGYVCSGSLLVDKDYNTYKPYFLTANHCIATEAVADTLEVYWNYDTSSCNGSAPSLSSLSRSNGSAVLSTKDMDSYSDFTLLLLDQDPPTGTYFLGWNASNSLIGYSIHGIHHPEGSYKRISFGTISQDLDFTNINENNYWVTRWSSGVTEGGSSGSPLILSSGDYSGQVVGQLTGGSTEYPCNNPSARDVYGRFSKTYPYISGYIDVTVGTYTMTPTRTGTRTPTLTATRTATPSPSFTRTATPTPSPTASPTPTRTFTGTRTSTLIATATPTPSGTQNTTETATSTATWSATSTPTDTESATPTRTPTSESTPSPTGTTTSSVGDQIFLYSLNWENPDGPLGLIDLLDTL